MSRLFYTVITVAILLAACNSHYDERRLQLLELQARNRADSLMTNDSLALALVAYFDRHGTANDRLLAHYLLGRTHADLGQTPQALEAYHDAADQADTTAADCDFAILSRVYAQMSDIFYRQNLMQDYLKSLDKSIHYAWVAKDTIQALNEYAHKMAYYSKTQNVDSVISVSENVYCRFLSLGYSSLAAAYYGYAIKSLLANERITEAKRHMDIYETKSGYFDSLGNIQKGREVYYNSKGQYYLCLHKYDSAEYFYRKELTVGHDLNNQNLASLGLAQLFQQTNHPDSAAKYALYSYEMNDSVYARMATQEVEQMQAMYNYGRHQKIAQQEKQRADYERVKSWWLIGLLLGMSLVGGLASFVIIRKRQKEKVLYRQRLEELVQVQSELLVLRQHEAELGSKLAAKEAAVVELQEKIANHQRRYNQDMNDANNKLFDSPVYQSFNKSMNKGTALSEKEWDQLNMLVIEVLPNFYRLISNRKYGLNDKEFRLCILLRLYSNASSSANLLGVVPSYVSKMSDKILHRLFQKDGTVKMLSEELVKYC